MSFFNGSLCEGSRNVTNNRLKWNSSSNNSVIKDTLASIE